MTQQDLNTCRVDDIIEIPGIPEYAGACIKRISDCGVTLAFRGGLTIVSGRSPAIVIRRGAFVLKPEPTVPIIPTQETDLAAATK